MSDKIKVLNLYACLGGNRLKWDEVADIEVTAVELDPELAKLYQERFPNDRVIVADAHAYLLQHFREYDFIWSSPPCPTHSKVRFTQKNTKSFQDVYPDMSLYQEILLLQNFFGGKWVVENVTPYYQPLMPAQKRGRHLYWANFTLPSVLSARKSIAMDCQGEFQKWCEFHDYDFRKYKGEQRLDKIARNLVDYEAGRTIFETAYNILNYKTNQELLW
jgi:DNA (cytosine-5)-methyltransferase 1